MIICLIMLFGIYSIISIGKPFADDYTYDINEMFILI